MNQSETDNWKTLGEALKQAFDSRDWFKLTRLDRTIIPASAYDTGADVSDPPFMPALNPERRLPPPSRPTESHQAR